MNIVPLTSESMADLRIERANFVKDMIHNQEGVLLVLGGAFAGENRQHQTVSYAVTSIFYELYERYTFDFWTYTFDAEGLMYYIRINESPESIKNTMVHYEDYHPLGFAIQSHVYTSDKKWTRDLLNAKERVDFYHNMTIDKLLNKDISDKKYEEAFIKKVENEIIKTDKQSVLSNILIYGYISAFTKPLGFGMYGPNQRGSNKQMNYKNFILLLRTYKNEMKNILHVNSKSYEDIRSFQKDIEKKIQLAVLTQESFYFSVHMTSLILFAFMNSTGYADISSQIKKLGDEFYEKHKNEEDSARYDITRTGLKEVFNFYVPFLQKNKNVVSTMLYILSRYDDVSVSSKNGEQNLLKIQFLAKNLIFKEDKWIELEKFSVSHALNPHDSTILLADTLMLDLIQRNYIKIKMIFD